MSGYDIGGAKNVMRIVRQIKQLLVLPGLLALPCLLAAADATPSTSWTDKIKLSGDFRYRHELISEESGRGAAKYRVPDRQRHRLRVRIGIQGQVNPQISVTTRLATSTFANGAGDPISTNQDLSGGFTSKPFWVDRAFVDYHPSKEFSARAGKFGVPFDGTELVWDSDLNVEGIAALPSITVNATEIFLGVGGFWAAERKSSDGPDQGLFVGQVGTTSTYGKLSGLLAVAYIDYGNVKNGPTLYQATKGAGNSVHTIGTSANTYYDNDFNLINITAQVQAKMNRADAILFGDFVTNTGAMKDTANTGWLAGLTMKFKRLPFDWECTYNYRVLQADATLGAFADSDPSGGGTNYDGHKISASLTLLPNTRFGFTYFRNRKDPDDGKQNYNRLTVDLEAKF